MAYNGTSKGEVTARLADVVKLAGGPSEVSRRARLSLSTLNNYLSGRSEMKIPALVAISRACGVSMEWLATGIDVPKVKDQIDGAPITRVLRFSVRPSAGGGSLVVDDSGAMTDLTAVILDALRLRPEQVRLMSADGSSMAPTIDDGDTMIVDVSETARERVRDGLIYVFSVGDSVYVKRLRRSPAGLHMRSDNTELFPDEELLPATESIHIHGLVRWVCGPI